MKSRWLAGQATASRRFYAGLGVRTSLTPLRRSSLRGESKRVIVMLDER
jgi:hypothetical protein